MQTISFKYPTYKLNKFTRRTMKNDTIDTLESAYDKIAAGRWTDIRVYHSDIYYITYLINYSFFKDSPEKHLEPREVDQMLYDEGLKPWKEYGIPPKYIRKLEQIRFKHVPDTRPDYNQ